MTKCWNDAAKYSPPFWTKCWVVRDRGDQKPFVSEAWLGDNGWYCYTGGRTKIIQNESSILYWMIKEPEPALPQTIRYPVPEEEY